MQHRNYPYHEIIRILIMKDKDTIPMSNGYIFSTDLLLSISKTLSTCVHYFLTIFYFFTK